MLQSLFIAGNTGTAPQTPRVGLGGEGTPEEKTSPSSFAASLFVLIGLATAILKLASLLILFYPILLNMPSLP